MFFCCVYLCLSSCLIHDRKVIQTSLHKLTALMNSKFKEFDDRLGVLENSGFLNSSGSISVSVQPFIPFLLQRLSQIDRKMMILFLWVKKIVFLKVINYGIEENLSDGEHGETEHGKAPFPPSVEGLRSRVYNIRFLGVYVVPTMSCSGIVKIDSKGYTILF